MNLYSVILTGSALLSIAFVTSVVIPRNINIDVQGLHFAVRPKAKKRKKVVSENNTDTIHVLYDKRLDLENIMYNITVNSDFKINDIYSRVGQNRFGNLTCGNIRHSTLLFISEETIHDPWFKYKVHCSLENTSRLIICLDQNLNLSQLPEYLKYLVHVSEKIFSFTCNELGQIENAERLCNEVCNAINTENRFSASQPSGEILEQQTVHVSSAYNSNTIPLLPVYTITGQEQDLVDQFHERLEKHHLHICQPRLGQYRFEAMCNAITQSSKIFVLVTPELFKDPLFPLVFKYALMNKGWSNIVLVLSGKCDINENSDFCMALSVCTKMYLRF